MKKLRLLREKRDLTQSELAKEFKISSSTIAMYERGERKPDPEMLIRIADFFDISVDYLLGRDSSKTDQMQYQTSLEDLELLRQIKQASADKQLAIELILGIKEQAAIASSDK